jgi:hypothetical protein
VTVTAEPNSGPLSGITAAVVGMAYGLFRSVRAVIRAHKSRLGETVAVPALGVDMRKALIVVQVRLFVGHCSLDAAAQPSQVFTAKGCTSVWGGHVIGSRL